MGEIILRMGKNVYNHIEIAHVTCPNILKMGGVQNGAMKSLCRTLLLSHHCLYEWGIHHLHALAVLNFDNFFKEPQNNNLDYHKAAS